MGNKRVYPATPYVITHICALVTKYYYANGQRVAMRVEGTPYYLLTDHLGSTAITANSSGTPCPPCRGAVPPQEGA